MSNIEQISVSVNDEQNVKYLVEDLHSAYGLPHSSHLGNCPEVYKDSLKFVAKKLVEFGWKKEEV